MRKILNTALSLTLLLFSTVLVTSTAKADGKDQTASHLDLEKRMMRYKYLITLGVTSLIATLTVFSTQIAHADQSITYANVNYAGTAYLDSTRDLQIDITPLANNSDTWRYLNFAWSKNDQTKSFGAQVGVDVYSSGTQHNFVLSFYGAIDEQVISVAGNSVTCDKRNPYDLNGQTYFQAVCWTPYTLAPGHTFRLRVYNNAALGPTWFNASFEDLTSKKRLEVGSINIGNKNFSDPLQYVQYGMGGIDSNPDCSKVGINDTIISSVKSGNSSLSTLASQSIGSCVNAVIVPNKYSLGGNVVKFGGTNPVGRNLEATAALNTSSNKVRVPRLTSAVPRPAEISPGLIQNRYSTYFADSTLAFDVPPSTSYQVVETLPEYLAASGPRDVYSMHWTGYFIPDYSGTWNFRLTSDDAAYLYIGANAVLNYTRDIHSALIDLGGTHPYITKSATIDLVKDQVYPFRIMYGNALDVSVFKLEFQAPGFADFQTDYKSLFWHSTPGPCSNWGMDYIFVGDLGYEKTQVGIGNSLKDCKRSYGKTNFTPVTGSDTSSSGSTATKKTIVNKPSFSLINIVGNKLNVNVNLGPAGTSKPDSVYLVAPKLGILDSNKLFGKVSGSKASWSIDFDKLLSGTAIPLKVVGVKNGVESDPLEQDFNAPAVVEKLLTNKLVPVAPKNVKSRIVGTSALISAEATVKTGSLATQAFVFGPSIGLSKANAITGDIVGNKILLEVPLKTSMAGKKLPVTIYLSNEVGDSQPVQTTIVVPSAPKIPSGTIKLPTQTKAPKTIFCVKGLQTRTFAAKSCPPGWKTA